MTLYEWIAEYCEENELELPDGIPNEKSALDFLILNKPSGIHPEGTINITENGDNIDVTQYATANVNVQSVSTDRLVLLKEVSLGTISTASTSAVDTGIDVSLNSSTNWKDYDLFIVDVSTASNITEGLLATDSFILSTGSTIITTKSTVNMGYHSWTCVKKENGDIFSRDVTGQAGIYPRNPIISGSDLNFDVYQKYNSSTTGTINSSYTLRVYGIKLVDLIGG